MDRGDRRVIEKMTKYKSVRVSQLVHEAIFKFWVNNKTVLEHEFGISNGGDIFERGAVRYLRFLEKKLKK